MLVRTLSATAVSLNIQEIARGHKKKRTPSEDTKIAENLKEGNQRAERDKYVPKMYTGTKHPSET